MAIVFKNGQIKKRRFSLKKILIVIPIFITFLAVCLIYWYRVNIRPLDVSNNETKSVTIQTGMNEAQVAGLLSSNNLIRSSFAYEVYVRINGKSGQMQAGTYDFSPSMSVADITEKIVNGEVSANLITILPAQTLDQLKQSFIEYGYSDQEIDEALNPASYVGHPVLADKPSLASLEGYIYPESFLRTADTPLKVIITASLDQMNSALSADLKSAYANEGLSVREAIIIASIVEKEVESQEDREKAAQVFIKRYKSGMKLGSDVTAFYGAELFGLDRSVSTDTPYNTRIYVGLPPGPINNVSLSSLRAVAFPAKTDYLYFVAGDDGVTYFSKTLAEHEALTALHCIKLCN